MPGKKNPYFERPVGYAMPKGGTQTMRRSASAMREADIKLYGDHVAPHEPSKPRAKQPKHQAGNPDTRVYVGDCRDVLAFLPDKGSVDLIFSDSPFNWYVPYVEWDDGMPLALSERSTLHWFAVFFTALAPHGDLWITLPHHPVPHPPA